MKIERYNQTRIRYATDELADMMFVDAETFSRVTIDLEQRRYAEQQACQVAERRVEELLARAAKLEGDNRSMRALMRKRHKQHESRKQTLRAVVKGGLKAEQVKP